MKNNNSKNDIKNLNEVSDEIREVKKKKDVEEKRHPIETDDFYFEEKTEIINEDATNSKKGGASGAKAACAAIYDFVEMIAVITIIIILCFAFVLRLNVVDGPSMENTLHTGEYLVVSDLLYKPRAGDIVVLHDMTASEKYNKPLVKRVIATEGQTVDIDFDTWTLTVDGKVVDESSYANLEGEYLLRADYDFPITIDKGCVFVMGDHRNNSADSRKAEIGQIDERNIVGKVYARIFPFNKFKLFSNPYDE